MLPKEVRDLALTTTVVDGIGGTQITNCFDGTIEYAIINAALATWE